MSFSLKKKNCNSF